MAKIILVVLFFGLLAFYLVARRMAVTRGSALPSGSRPADAPPASGLSGASSSVAPGHGVVEDGCEDPSCQLRTVCHPKPKEAAVYYDDEELDAFALREADSYSASEVDAFAYVLHTMRASEVSGWLNSLCMRRVSLPMALRSEALAIVAKAQKTVKEGEAL